jgi:hypothetical protein
VVRFGLSGGRIEMKLAGKIFKAVPELRKA